MKFIVAQIGARRRYAVPAILKKAGILERFYTDITGDLAFGAFLSAMAVLPFLRKPVRRLALRRLPENIRRKTTTFPILSFVHGFRRAMINRTPVPAFREAIRF